MPNDFAISIKLISQPFTIQMLAQFQSHFLTNFYFENCSTELMPADQRAKKVLFFSSDFDGSTHSLSNDTGTFWRIQKQLIFFMKIPALSCKMLTNKPRNHK
jgi:hypothetical protein